VYNTPVAYPSNMELARTYRLYSEKAEYDSSRNFVGQGSDTNEQPRSKLQGCSFKQLVEAVHGQDV